ncbi:MAG: transcription elongation GreA/GreB family factor [Myxococcota bacterium]|jgi:transcription elongation GreA/GreB family factor
MAQAISRTLDKAMVLAALIAQVEAEVSNATQNAATTSKGVTHSESRQENDKDTRAIEASYLARGQALRVEELAEVATRLRQLVPRPFGPDDAVGLGALVEVALDGEDAHRWYLLVPVGGGRAVTVDGFTVRAVSSAAPVGYALVGKAEGDDATVKVPGGTVLFEVVTVS